MKTKLTKKEVQEKIDEFFSREHFKTEELKKIKRLAMKFNIKLGKYKKLFCRKCHEKLRGKIRITKYHKTTVCNECGFANKIKTSILH